MKVLRASRAGFCMGVGLALQKLKKALVDERELLSDKRICTLGPIIHNPQVMQKFARQGVTCLESEEEARDNDIVLIRAHGIPRNTEEKLRAACANVIDATCPRVKNAQLAIASATANGEELLLFGESEHPEVRGLVSYANGATKIFAKEEELDGYPLSNNRQYVLASQTTQDRDSFDSLASHLKMAFPGIVILSTICDATRERQQEALELAHEVEAMVVAGGRESGNTRRLASLARQAGIPTWHIETVHELDKNDFSQKAVVGLTAGASTPKSLIDEVEKWLLEI